MTKLEQKLIELGYEQWRYNLEFITYTKTYNDKVDLNIYVTDNKDKIVDWFVYVEEFTFKEQKYIDYLQQAFNQLQQDLEELKKLC